MVNCSLSKHGKHAYNIDSASGNKSMLSEQVCYLSSGKETIKLAHF